jgi:hypothetical protein
MDKSGKESGKETGNKKQALAANAGRTRRRRRLYENVASRVCQVMCGIMQHRIERSQGA